MKWNILQRSDAIDDAVRRVRRGDSAAYADIVRALEGPLRTWLAVHTPPGIDADDIAQQSFVAAYSRLDDYKLGTNFSAWLFTIARFQLRTETTRLRRVADYHTRYAPDFLQRELDRRGDEPPEHLELRLSYLQRCLEELGDQSQLFVNWRYEEEIPLDEMAERSGRSTAAVKKQLWKIRRLLQTCVETRMIAEGEMS